VQHYDGDVLTEVLVYAIVGTIDRYGACDVRGALVGCLIFTLLVSVLGSMRVSRASP